MALYVISIDRLITATGLLSSTNVSELLRFEFRLYAHSAIVLNLLVILTFCSSRLNSFGCITINTRFPRIPLRCYGLKEVNDVIVSLPIVTDMMHTV